MPYLLALAVAVLLAVLIAETSRASLARSTVSARLHKSESVLRFFTNHAWMVARRHEKCRGVPWQRTCTIARGLVREHTRARRAQRRWLYRHLPVSNDWVTSVRIVQRVYPGTEGWLLSCSAAESSHGAWVRYGGSPYYPGYEHTNQVGGPVQYRWLTFKGHYRHGLEKLRARGFHVDLPPPDDVRAWLSMTGQAIAAGWARWSGNDASHWRASWGRGC